MRLPLGGDNWAASLVTQRKLASYLVSGGAGLELVANCSNWDFYLTRRTAPPNVMGVQTPSHFHRAHTSQKMELSTALFLPLLLLDVVFFQEGLGLKCWHTGLIILEAIKSPFFSIWYCFLAQTSSKWQGCFKFLTINCPRWDQQISDISVFLCLRAADIDAKDTFYTKHLKKMT